MRSVTDVSAGQPFRRFLQQLDTLLHEISTHWPVTSAEGGGGQCVVQGFHKFAPKWFGGTLEAPHAK